MQRYTTRSGRLAIAVVSSVCVVVTALAQDTPQSPIEVHEWSVWVGNPAQTSVNGTRTYKNAMPNVVGTNRPKLEDKDPAIKFPLAPISVMQFFGEPHKDIDIDLRIKKGVPLAHWPPSNERGGRLQWFKSDVTKEPPAQIPPSYLPPNHWFQKLRDNASALYLKQESHFERFIAYDTELPIPIPIKIRGGPDEYTLTNLTNHRLLDVAVIAPADGGFRVGWLDELPTASEEKKEETKKPDKRTDKQKAEAVFKEAEKKKDEKKEPELPPLPAEADPNVRARIDQQLNRPVSLNVQKAPRQQVLELITGQVRLQYELDEPSLKKAEINLGQTTDMTVNGLAARDALADLLGNLSLSYRVTDTGKLYITTAARLADEASKKGVVVEGPPVKLVVPPPLKASNPSYREVTRDAMARRLQVQGLREDVVRILLDEYGKLLFEPGELIVLVHLARPAIDEVALLDVFPPPKKIVRTALLVIHGVDPRLQDRARTLVVQLGDQSPKVREAAESKLAELGPVAVPALEDALVNKDVEIVFRAERLLMRLNRPVP
jgi:hypothetical protein